MTVFKPFREQRSLCFEEVDFEAEEFSDGYCGINSRTKEESASECIFSDDTGFYSAQEEEAAGDTETGEEDENTLPVEQVAAAVNAEEAKRKEVASADEKELRLTVEKNYTSLVQKYTVAGFVDSVKDLFDKQVNFDEIRMVLLLSITPEHWKDFVMPALLLDTVTRLWAKQVVQAYRETGQVVEMLAYQNKSKQMRRSRQMPDFTTNEADEGYASQSSSQQDQNAHKMMEKGYNDEETCNRLFKKNKSFVVAKEQLLNDFARELSATVVSRRRFFHERCRQLVQNPYVDYQFNLQEYYEDYEEPEKIMEIHKSGRLGQTAKGLLQNMKRFTKDQEMSKLDFPSLKCFMDDVNDEMEQENEAGCLIENEELMEVDIAIDLNNENIQPILLPPFSIGPLEVGASLENHRENLVVIPAALGAMGDNGENVPPPKIKEKKKRKKRRIPLLEKQNINTVFGEELTGDFEAKRLRLNIEGAGFELEHEQVLHQQNVEGLMCHSDLLLVLNYSGTDGNSDPTDAEVHNNGNSGDMNFLNLTVAECETTFRPPSLLFENKDASVTINVKEGGSRVDMSAIKSKFNKIIQHSFHSDQELSPISFVQILQKSEMDIIVGPNEKISPSNSNAAVIISSSSTSNECSVGVAFLAMLHNASIENYFLMEDNEGAFTVTRNKPTDCLPNIFDNRDSIL